MLNISTAFRLAGLLLVAPSLQERGGGAKVVSEDDELVKRILILFVAVEAWVNAHDRARHQRKSQLCKRGVFARCEKRSKCGTARYGVRLYRGQLYCRIRGVTHAHGSDDNLTSFARKCVHSGARDGYA